VPTKVLALRAASAAGSAWCRLPPPPSSSPLPPYSQLLLALLLLLSRLLVLVLRVSTRLSMMLTFRQWSEATPKSASRTSPLLLMRMLSAWARWVGWLVGWLVSAWGLMLAWHVSVQQVSTWGAGARASKWGGVKLFGSHKTHNSHTHSAP
jgi:hypothetical protein